MTKIYEKESGTGMNYINTLREGDNITDIYFCKQKTVAQTKAGKTYYSLTLQDMTGTIDAKIWELSNAIEHFEALDFIKVSGQITSFNNNLQFNVRRVQKAREGEYDVSDYMPTTKFNIEDMYKELLDIIESIREEHLSALLKDFFVADGDFVSVFKKHSAAKSIHHGFIGGLLQHTLTVAKICNFYASIYPVINRDLLLTAAICHDIGKLKEISSFPENDYTDDGNLLGHIVIGTMMVRDKAAQIDGFPVQLLSELEHCILSHHGELEFGSPKKPALIEAVALAFADNTDAKLEAFQEELDKSSESTDWLGWNKMFDANIRRTV